MPDTPIDLRSDTVTRPTAATRGAMQAAVVGNDVFHEDRIVNCLEERVLSVILPSDRRDAGPTDPVPP